ncbi:sugar ABC transporter substrate-binding protein [Bacillus taeanensis]|uniref:Sugar ABC transporter substrate-binding protein n=2 Tax=Bacillus taeanensis TaxID=273032 RepID=A0A366XVS5_9BACI|nr:sugar ABC transporter substrate-binding protein [Bacillus taeanensis]
MREEGEAEKMRYSIKVVFYIFMLLIISACTLQEEPFDPKSTNAEHINPNVLVEAPFKGKVEGLPTIEAPQGFDWKQFEGTELTMISENTPPSAALAANIDKFEAVTGIKVTIEQMDFVTVIEKVGLDFNAKASNYDIIYADPYQILTKYQENFVDLNLFNKEPTMPHIPGGVEDFIQSQVDVVSYMENKEKFLALPYDASTMVLAYRKDVFEKYKEMFIKEMGYDWTPGESLTWQKYYEIGKWINKKVEDGTITEVKYGIGHQAERHDSLMNDFSNILAANGGDYLENSSSRSIGTNTPGNSTMTSEAAVQSLKFYKQLLSIAAPGSTSWDWRDLAEVFAKGELAMAPQWHDYSAVFANSQTSKVADKVGWTVLPKGTVRRAHTYGGTGIAINKYANSREKKAAWLFLVWATSPQSQYMILKSEEGGTIPTRQSVYKLPEVQRGMEVGTIESKEMPNLLSVRAALQAWEEENMYIRPKIPQWPQINTFIFTELSTMLINKQSPEETAAEIAEKSDRVIKNK